MLSYSEANMNRKIDIYTRRKFAPRGFSICWQYECSTMQSKTCKEAKVKFCARYGLDCSQVKASFSK